MGSELYKKTLYTNKQVPFLFDHRIIERDIVSAGFNIIRHFHLLDNDLIESIGRLEKHERHVVIGKLEKNNEELKEGLKKGFRACRKKFFDENNIRDEEILSIKKDAIFLLDRDTVHNKFDVIEFALKNEYYAYMFLNKVEFYINDNGCDCKGIKDEKIELHKHYMLDILRDFSNLMIHSTKSKQLKFIKEVATAYRNRELKSGYYRELNKESLFRLNADIKVITNSMGLNEFDMDLKYLDISYNYTHYIIPMFQMLI